MDAPASTPLPITGAVTLHTAADWHRRFVEHLQIASSLVLEAGGITESDTNGVQLLCAARRTAAAQGLPFELRHPSDAVLRACACAGLSLQRDLAPSP